jgi:hypothetical protein
VSGSLPPALAWPGISSRAGRYPYQTSTAITTCVLQLAVITHGWWYNVTANFAGRHQDRCPRLHFGGDVIDRNLKKFLFFSHFEIEL